MTERSDVPAAHVSREDWDGAYGGEKRPGWDMDGPTPLVPEMVALGRGWELAERAHVAVPGCGRGHDAAALARLGFRVTGLDFAPTALAGARERYGDEVEWLEADWLSGSGPGPGPFDSIFDHTFFVAFPPAARPALVAAHARRLAPGGLWLGAFFTAVPAPDRSPYAIDPDELRALVLPAFELLSLAPATRSHPKRAGREILLAARRRG